MHVTREVVIVDVSGVDWSTHPGWAGDFVAEEMRCDSSASVPEWAGEIIHVKQHIIDEQGHREVRRVSPRRATTSVEEEALADD